jgi:exosortase family protein XrtF
MRSKKSIQFIIIGIGLYLVWLLAYQFLIKPYTILDYQLNALIVENAVDLLDIFGIQSYLEIESDHVLLLKDSEYQNAGVWVGDNCNGFKLFSIFSIFLLAYPGNWKSKIWYIPLGLLIIHWANVIRVAALFVISDHYPEYLNFNHLYTFTAFVYIVIFVLWIVWIRRFGIKLNNES